MIKNYFKTAIRNIYRNATFTAINIFGLSVSLAVSLIIIMLVGDQMSMDRHLVDADQIYRINTQRLHSDDAINMFATTPLPIGEELANNYAGIDQYSRIARGFGNAWIDFDNDLSIPLAGFYTDNNFLNLFEVELAKGNPNTALTEPYSVVLTTEAAEKLYGDADPMGKVVDMDDLGAYTVTGVIAENDNKSHIVYEAMASFNTLPLLENDSVRARMSDSWNTTTAGWTYVKLNAETGTNDVLASLEKINEKQYGQNELVDYKFHLQSLLDINPGPLLGNQIGPGIPIVFVYFLAGLALVIMLSACFNYTNLSIAKSLTRAREVGIRKVSGALKRQIFFQFITESVVVTILSLLVALVLVIAIEPAFQEIGMARLLHWKLSFQWPVLLASFVYALFIGLAAGTFPSLVFSSFEPIAVLKNLNNIQLFSKIGLRKVLLTGQLVLSLFFIVTVIVLYNQVQVMTQADKGFVTDNMINIRLSDTDGELLKTELKKLPMVESATLTSHVPAAGTTLDEYFLRSPEDERQTLDYFAVDEDYLAQMDIELIAGRDIAEGVNDNDENEILINESAVGLFEFADAYDALGKTIYNQDTLPVTVVGVVEDYNYAALTMEIGAMAIRQIPGHTMMHVQLAGDRSESAIARVDQVWSRINPEKQMQYKYLADEINEFYELTFGDITKIIMFFSFIAISIAILGLLGMAIYTTQTRVREISIRKVLGASNKSVVYLISSTFLKLLVLSAVIALPLSYFVNNLWLEFIAYRTEVSFGMMVLGAFVLFVLGLLTIGSQTIRVAWTNPADNLKQE